MHATIINLPALAVIAENVEPQKLYIWKRPDAHLTVVRTWVDDNGLPGGIETLHDNDMWYFEHGLIGSLHGPVELA